MTDPIALIEKARILWKTGHLEEALHILENPLLKEDAAAAFLAGEIQYSCQNWGAALNKFRRCLQIDPNLEAAQTYVDMILNILGFFHTDQFNP